MTALLIASIASASVYGPMYFNPPPWDPTPNANIGGLTCALTSGQVFDVDLRAHQAGTSHGFGFVYAESPEPGFATWAHDPRMGQLFSLGLAASTGMASDCLAQDGGFALSSAGLSPAGDQFSVETHTCGDAFAYGEAEFTFTAETDWVAECAFYADGVNVDIRPGAVAHAVNINGQVEWIRFEPGLVTSSTDVAYDRVYDGREETYRLEISLTGQPGEHSILIQKASAFWPTIDLDGDAVFTQDDVARQEQGLGEDWTVDGSNDELDLDVLDVLWEAGIGTVDQTCAVDMNATGGAEIDDLFLYLSAWFAGDADFNGDGTTSLDDLFAFLSAWFTGC